MSVVSQYRSVHFKEKAGSCHLCGIELSTLHGLRGHLRTVHQEVEAGGDDQECGDCGEAFQERMGFQRPIGTARNNALWRLLDYPYTPTKLSIGEIPDWNGLSAVYIGHVP